MKTVKLPNGETVTVADLFTGWWCTHCNAARKYSEDLEAPCRCHQCHKLTVWWVAEADTLTDNSRPRRQNESHRGFRNIRVRATRQAITAEPPKRYIIHESERSPFDLMRDAVDKPQ